MFLGPRFWCFVCAEDKIDGKYLSSGFSFSCRFCHYERGRGCLGPQFWCLIYTKDKTDELDLSTADSVSRLGHGERGRGCLLQRHRLRASALQCWRLQVVPSSCVLEMIEYDWHSIKQHNQWKQSPCQNIELSKLQHFFFSWPVNLSTCLFVSSPACSMSKISCWETMLILEHAKLYH